MSCLWQGCVDSVAWPRHDPPVVSLPLEMWWANGQAAALTLDGATLAFDKYAFVKDTPLWEICGPEIAVMTRDPSCREFLAEFAGTQQILLRLLVVSDAPMPLTHILVFPVHDGAVVKLLARPLNANFGPPKRVPTVPSKKPPASVTDRLAPQQSSLQTARDDTKQPTPKAVPDVKRALQQTLMGALRLRGIRSSDPNFKKIYYLVHGLVELVLQRTADAEISLELIHGKVEAILSAID